jgi:ADP-heptose:LPS heptosyltransferase
MLQADAPRAGWNNEFGIYPGNYSLPDYARVIKGLDLLITVDSMPAHLAGALGVPVWTLLRTEADWRWMDNREDSPWYPTMRLFRQLQSGNWEEVINRVTEELSKLNKGEFA